MGGLRSADGHSVLHRDDGLLDGEAPHSKVNVLPAQTEDFASAHARCCCQMEGSVEPVVGECLEEDSQLGWRPGEVFMPDGNTPAGWICAISGVVWKHPLAYRVTQCLVDNGMQVADRLDREPASFVIRATAR